MIRVLQELSALDGGGVAKLLYDYYRNMDHTKVHFDFLIYDYYENGMYEDPLKAMGCIIYKLPRIKKNKIGYLIGMRRIIKEGNYDVIHSHMGSRGFFVMYYGKKYKVPKRIVHSHIAYESVSNVKRKMNTILAAIAKYYATDLFACGKDAGIYMWGEKASLAGKVHIMTNAIDTDSFKFSNELRIQKQEELQITGKFVIGVVGRLSEQKNYPFLFSVYKKVIEQRDDTILLVVGRGLEEDKIKKLAIDMNLGDSIRFLGIRSDVSELLNAFDLFVLPSKYEGLPVVLIEAQANGVRELVSDRVTTEMNITDLIKYLPIDNAEEQWKNEICSRSIQTYNREKYCDLIRQAGYDIKTESKKMQNFYCNTEG